MGVISKMASKCQSCPDKEKCDHKRMQFEAYFDEPIGVTYGIENAMPLVQENDLQSQIARQIEQSFYKKSGLMFGR